MNERVILNNIILALVNQSYGTNKNKYFKDTVLEALSLIRLPTVAGMGSDEASLKLEFKSVIDDLLSLEDDQPIDLRYLKIKLKPITPYHKEVIEDLLTEIENMPNKDPEDANKDYFIYYNLINTFIKQQKFAKIFREYSYKLVEQPGRLKEREPFLKEFNDKLAPYVSSSLGNAYTNVPGIISALDVEDDELEELYAETQDLFSELGVLKTDLQGWNQLLGKHGGFLRGEMTEIQALSGMSKSETMRKILTGVAKSNTPHMLDPTKKPLILYLTFEDTQREVFEKLFIQLYREEHDKLVNVGDFTPKEVKDYVHDTLRARGYHFKVIYGEKSSCTPYDVLNLLERIQEDGYEIHQFGLDYLLLLDLSNVPGPMETYKIKNGYGILGSYTKSRGISFITAAQIDDYAKRILEDSDEFARDAVNANVSAGSKYILHELDLRLFVHIVETPEGAFHQMAKGKHRAGKGTPLKHRYAVYLMHSVEGEPGGFIRSDLDGESQVRDSTRGNLRSQGGGLMF